MLGSVNRSRRDSTLFQFTTKRLRDFIDPNHLLIRIDERTGTVMTTAGLPYIPKCSSELC